MNDRTNRPFYYLLTQKEFLFRFLLSFSDVMNFIFPFMEFVFCVCVGDDGQDTKKLTRGHRFRIFSVFLLLLLGHCSVVHSFQRRSHRIFASGKIRMGFTAKGKCERMNYLEWTRNLEISHMRWTLEFTPEWWSNDSFLMFSFFFFFPCNRWTIDTTVGRTSHRHYVDHWHCRSVDCCSSHTKTTRYRFEEFVRWQRQTSWYVLTVDVDTNCWMSILFVNLIQFRNGYDGNRSSGYWHRTTTICGRLHIETRHRKTAGHFERTKK